MEFEGKSCLIAGAAGAVHGNWKASIPNNIERVMESEAWTLRRVPWEQK